MIQALPEEVLHEIIPFLLGEDDHEYESYPESMYHNASNNIISLSLVNRLLRGICFPFLFPYLRCKSIERLETLGNECLAQSAFTGFIKYVAFSAFRHVDDYTTGRILDVDMDCVYNTTIIQSIQEGIVRLLGCPLPSLVWLKVHEIPMNESLLAAINAHHSLETAAVLPRNLLSPSSSPVTLEKLLFSDLGGISNLSVVQQRNARINRLHLDNRLILEDPVCKSQLETLFIRDLRALSITEANEVKINAEALEPLHAFIKHHPSLTNIILTTSTSWEDCSFSKPYISSFLDVVGDHFLGGAIDLAQVALSRTQSTSSDRWTVTGLDLKVHSNSLEAVALAGTMFPKVSSLTLSLQNDLGIHIDDFVDLISNHFPNLRVLDLRRMYLALVWTPALIPTSPEVPADWPFNHVVACTRRLAWRIFEASSSITKVSIQEKHKIDRPDSRAQWSLSASYRPRRDLVGTIFKMEVDEEWSVSAKQTIRVTIPLLGA
ncbi:hypothetical protein C8J56DRAFT_536124 [Mycena floridula]|nr:hypothetical protein C8J56DRAFT_536124 [Mycena floridula]